MPESTKSGEKIFWPGGGGMKRDEILRILSENKAIWQEHYGIRRIGLFGSFARGEEQTNSDVDLFVEFDRERIDLEKYLQFIEEVENIFGRKVDIITRDGKESIRIPEVKKNIEKDMIYV